MESSTRFDPQEAEPRIYRFWEETGCFKADAGSPREPYSVVIPPPNVTGSLHMGHALNNTLQDILTRMKRMQGFEALYLPGTDHAGIATQTVVEKDLLKEKKTRWDIGREEFLKRVWKWKEEYGGTILYQLRRLGCGCDWSRTRFTLDEGYSRSVRHVFVSLFKKGLIYKGLAIVNWCPKDLTALSDLEVMNRKSPGSLWHIKYPVKERPGTFVTVATTRPETMLGDTGVAVHPEDVRYRDLVGKTLLLPLTDREIPVVADAFVDREFGSGAVKVTPAHDANDFDCARRTGLAALAVMDEKGRMNDAAGPYRGLDRNECRKRVVADLEAKGLLAKIEDHEVPRGHCYRCDTVVEPYLSEQWFVAMKTLAAPAIDAVRRGDVKFHPDRWSKVYFDWMENLRDWCISRQIWWGHRIPAWLCPASHVTVSVEDPDRCAECGDPKLVQDENVLDTWFSSALWPFATLGWPDETPDLRKFYPTRVLVTGRDIINLWVARMIVSGLEFRGEKPFSDVVINATIMDDDGQRMSKSKGTGVDPLELIDAYGADALRFSLAWLATGTQDLKFGRNLSRQRVEMGRNFVTKLWNAARYVSQKTGDADPRPGDADEDRWIASRLTGTLETVTRALDRYAFNEAAQALYDFAWNDFCDWSIELSKRRAEEPAARGTLAWVLDTLLRLLHPIMPFVTEEIWQKLGNGRPPLAKAAWPEPDASLRAPDLEQRMARVFEAVRAVREIRNRNGLSPKVALSAVLSAQEEDAAAHLRAGSAIIQSQAGVDGLSIGVGLPKPGLSGTIPCPGFTVYVPLEGKIDLDAERDRTRKQIGKTSEAAAQAERRLADAEFCRRKPELADETRRKLEEYRTKASELEAHLAELGDRT